MFVAKDSKSPPAAGFTGTAGCFHWRIARTTRRKQAPLRAKTILAPAREINRPPNAGPIIPEMLNCRPLKVAAEGKSASETTCGTIDVQAGALKANPTPIKNTLTRMRKALRRCSQPSSAKVEASAASPTLIEHISFGRSTLSAKAPAGRVNRKKGSEATVDRSEIKKGDPVKIFIIQVAALSWAATQV